LINRFFTGLLGHSNEMTRLSLAKSELVKTFDEGHEVGVLSRTQRQLIDGIISVSDQSVRMIAIPIHHYPLITSDMKPQTVLSLVRSLRMCEIPVFGKLDALDGLVPSRSHLVPVGYVRTIDLEVTVYRKEEKLPIRELVEVIDDYSFLTALNLFYTSGESLGIIVDSHKRCFGLISVEKLQEQLYRTTYSTV
jgi:CBS domain containing-hemolysin-like protein